MLISYRRPSSIAWSLIGDGAAFVSDDAGAALTNGRPAAACRLQWLTSAQTTASVLTLRGTWGTALVPRVVGLVGLTLPIGTLISLAFRRAADAGYTYQEDVAQQRVTALPDGTRCAWFVLDAGLDPVIGLEYRIANDVDGAASIEAGSTFDVGEAWMGPAVEIEHQADWKYGVTDPSAIRRSKGSQIFGSDQRSFRTLQATFARAYLVDVRGEGLIGGMDWETVMASLRGNSRGVALPRFDSASEIQRTAILGRFTFDAVGHLSGPLYAGGMSIEEAPAAEA